MSETIECRAQLRGRTWVANSSEHGVYGQGKSLKKVRASITDGLALVGVTAEVTIIPTTPELEELRAAQDICEAAVRDAVAALHLRRASLTDIALATGLSTRKVKLLLAEHSTSPKECEVISDSAP